MIRARGQNIGLVVRKTHVDVVFVTASLSEPGDVLADIGVVEDHLPGTQGQEVFDESFGQAQ